MSFLPGETDMDSRHPHRLPRGLYLITPDDPDEARLLARVMPLLPHVACLQYRNKLGATAPRKQQARALQLACRDAGVPFIVNDDPVLAAEVGADGVHLGEHDSAIAAARGLLGNQAIIGVSCYDDASLACHAAASGADYIAFGAFFPSTTKPGARHATVALLHETRALGLTQVAIGGITPDNAHGLIAAGANLIAVISGVFDAPDPLAATRGYAALFD